MFIEKIFQISFCPLSMFHNISLKVGNWDCCTRFFGHHLFFQINFVFLPSFILPSSSFPHIFCPQILPLPLPSGLPSFSGQNRGQGQGQNLRAKYMGRWRRGQKRGQNQKLLECRKFKSPRDESRCQNQLVKLGLEIKISWVPKTSVWLVKLPKTAFNPSCIMHWKMHRCKKMPS